MHSLTASLLRLLIIKFSRKINLSKIPYVIISFMKYQNQKSSFNPIQQISFLKYLKEFFYAHLL